MMVAAGSGMAQLIDDHGNRVDSVAPMTVGILEGEMVARRDLTVYTRGGWVFPWVCLVVGGVWMGWIFVRWVFVERGDEF